MKKESLTLAPVARELALQLGGREVFFSPECVGENIEKVVNNAPDGGVILLENLRFHVEEEGKGVDASGEKVKADPEKVKEFRAQLSKLGDLYINDAFGTAHRAHSSMVGVEAEYRVAGKLMEKELNYFGKVLENPDKPLLGIMGGAKISDKIQLINNMLDKVDVLIIAGGMAFSFLKEKEENPMKEIGSSLYDDQAPTLVPEIMKNATDKNVKIILPVDFLCAKNDFFGLSDADKANVEVKPATLESGIEEGWMGLDCGPKSRELFASTIAEAKTIVWNGPPGVFEFDKFADTTKDMLKAVIANEACVSVIGGGDTANAVKKFGGESGVTHISTGGGASLELLEGKILPGVAALSDKPVKEENANQSS
jgi:phosphoglycerate kinase